MLQLVERVGEMSGKLDGILTEQRRVSDVVVAQDRRIGAVETRIAGLLGWAAGAGAVGAFVMEWVRGMIR